MSFHNVPEAAAVELRQDVLAIRDSFAPRIPRLELGFDGLCLGHVVWWLSLSSDVVRSYRHMVRLFRLVVGGCYCQAAHVARCCRGVGCMHGLLCRVVLWWWHWSSVGCVYAGLVFVVEAKALPIARSIRL